MRGILSLLLSASLTLTGCSSDAVGSTPAAGPSGSAPSASVSVGGVSGLPVRSCESHVVGDISGWRRMATVVGPVGFAGLASYADAPERFFRPQGERFPTLKSLLIVERGPAVTIRILQPDRARLLYDPEGWTSRRTYRLQQGEPAMVFEPCPHLRSTQFNGAWLVTGRVCVTVQVSVAGGTVERAEVPLGRASCA
jgi:hypothetical protein